MATVEPIRIEGLRDLQATLKALDGESQKLLRGTLNEVAETVAAGARRRVPTRSGRLKASIKVASSQREARVKGGSAKVPYYGFVDYGGAVGIGKSVTRPYVKRGRYLYPTYYANQASIRKGLAEAVDRLITRVGLDAG